MSEKQRIMTPLMEYLEQIEFPIIDKKQELAVSDHKRSDIDKEKRQIEYESFAKKALECLKIAAGYTEDF